MSKRKAEQTRVLKIEEVGDFYHQRTHPCLRLKGQWLAGAGLFPNHHVRVENPRPGVLVVRLLER